MLTRRNLLLFGAAGLGASVVPGLAAACPAAKAATGCVYVPEPNHRTVGSLEQPLEHWVWACHPDYGKLIQPRWWSYVMTTDRSYGVAVERVLKNPRKPLPDEVKVSGEECRQQWFAPGWRVLTVTNCRRQDRRWTFLLSRQLTVADHGGALEASDWLDLEPVFDI